jgi:signal transduction histidine kinase
LRKSKDRKFFVIEVTDSWIGIKKSDLSKLFQKFSQIGSHLNKTEKGTWLWLSICKEIAEGMWWTIGVRSEFWEWSTFFVRLPFTRKISKK